MTHTAHPVRHAADVIHGWSPSAGRSRRTLLTWAVIIAGFVVAAGLVVLATTSGTSTTQIDPTAPPAAPAQPGVPLSPDQAERYLANQG
jgi:hypothetical protein